MYLTHVGFRDIKHEASALKQDFSEKNINYYTENLQCEQNTAPVMAFLSTTNKIWVTKSFFV